MPFCGSVGTVISGNTDKNWSFVTFVLGVILVCFENWIIGLKLLFERVTDFKGLGVVKN